MKVANDIDTRGIGGCNVSAQHVKMPNAGSIRNQVHARLDDGIASAETSCPLRYRIEIGFMLKIPSSQKEGNG